MGGFPSLSLLFSSGFSSSRLSIFPPSCSRRIGFGWKKREREKKKKEEEKASARNGQTRRASSLAGPCGPGPLDPSGAVRIPPLPSETGRCLRVRPRSVITSAHTYARAARAHGLRPAGRPCTVSGLAAVLSCFPPPLLMFFFLFQFIQKPKTFFKDFQSHKILQHIHRALNIDESKN